MPSDKLDRSRLVRDSGSSGMNVAIGAHVYFATQRVIDTALGGA